MNDTAIKTIREFYNLCRRKRVSHAILKAIPYVGESLYELVYGGDAEALIQRVMAENLERQTHILQRIEEIIKQMGDETSDSIVAIGGGNMEYIYRCGEEFLIGQKNLVLESHELVGGGGVNFAARLLVTNHEVFPILIIGNDRAGRAIQQQLLVLSQRSGRTAALQRFIASDDFFVPSIQTATATIIVQGAKRTILSYSPGGDAQAVCEHIFERLTDVESICGGKPGVIRISHIRNCDGAMGSGEIVKRIIREYSGKSLLIFNPGISQVQLGIKYWEKELIECDIVQLSLTEAKRLFAVDSLSTNLVDIIGWFMTRKVTIVITVGRFGAVGTYKNGKDGVVFASPLELEEIIDPTGAGDAFSAGLASQLLRSGFSFQDFHRAMDDARFWAAYACTTVGGANDCPDIDKLTRFRKYYEDKDNSHNPTQVIHRSQAEPYLRLIDKAFID